jgi:hypothetical protein
MTTLDLFDVWQSLLTLANVSQNGQIPPTTFANWMNAINVELFRDKFSDYELMQQCSDEVKLPFLVTASIVVTSAGGASYGVAPYPANYEYFSSAKVMRQRDEKAAKNNEPLPDIDGDGQCHKYTDPDYAALAIKYAGDHLITKTVNLVDNQRWEDCLDHDTKGPTYDNPKMTQFSGGFKIAPAGVQLLLIDYLKTPQPCVFAYTISSDDILIYNASGSTQLQWSNIMKEEFLSRLLKKYAILIGDENMFQMGENERKTA